MLLITALAAALAVASPAGGAAALPASSASRATREPVAFTRFTIPDAEATVEIGVWTSPETSAGESRPLVVMSHGSGGDLRGHEDTARALAAAGFVVAALTHTGDNWRDQSRATDVALRARQLHRLVDFMLGEWAGRATVDPNRVGAFGFSAGGFTVLVAAGGEPDLGKIVDHCRSHPSFYDCRLVSAHPLGEATTCKPAWTHDARIRAIVVAAPALGFAFAPEGLSAVTQPVQLWQAEADLILPSPFYAEPVRVALPRPPEFHLVAAAGHFDFLPPCAPELAANAPLICAPTPGFDRAAFHETFNREIVRFFHETLPPVRR